MKMYLSSYRVPTPQDLYDLLPKPTAECRLGIIVNAKDKKTPEEREYKLNSLREYLANLSLDGEFVDLRNYHSPDSTKTAINNFDVLFGAGGNCFVLRYAMQASGFDQVVSKWLEGGRCYVGESAGAMVMGASIRKAELVDDQSVAPEIIYDGVRAVDRIIVPHVDSPDYGQDIQAMLDYHAGDDRVVALRDNQALIVNDNVQRIVTG